MSPDEILTKSEERLVAREVVTLLRQKGVSYNQAARILKMSKKQIGNTPIYNPESGCKFTDRPDA